jgi:hypothetical protein
VLDQLRFLNSDRRRVGGRHLLDVLDPSIAARGYRLEVAGLSGLVSQYAPQLRDDAGQGVIGDGRVGPESLEYFLLAEEVARAPDHQRKEVECLGFKG